MGSLGSGPAMAEHAEPLSSEASSWLSITLFHTELKRIHNCAADLINKPGSEKATIYEVESNVRVTKK